MATSNSTSKGNGEGGDKDPNRPRFQSMPASHMALVISDGDEFVEDPHEVVLSSDDYAVPLYFTPLDTNLVQGYLPPVSVLEFCGMT